MAFIGHLVTRFSLFFIIISPNVDWFFCISLCRSKYQIRRESNQSRKEKKNNGEEWKSREINQLNQANCAGQDSLKQHIFARAKISKTAGTLGINFTQMKVFSLERKTFLQLEVWVSLERKETHLSKRLWIFQHINSCKITGCGVLFFRRPKRYSEGKEEQGGGRRSRINWKQDSRLNHLPLNPFLCNRDDPHHHGWQSPCIRIECHLLNLFVLLLIYIYIYIYIIMGVQQNGVGEVQYQYFLLLLS